MQGACTCPPGGCELAAAGCGTDRMPPAPPPRPAAQQVRLVGGGSALQGRLEALNGGQWGTVCDEAFSDREADVSLWFCIT